MLLFTVVAFISACGNKGENIENAREAAPTAEVINSAEPSPSPTAVIPNLQTELLDDRNKQTASPLGTFDFKNYTYPLPRGWQNPDNTDITLVNGRVEPVSVDTDVGMSPDELAARKARRRIGMSYVTAKYLDVNGDGQDEAAVILKIETTGAAIPQLVYIYEWKDEKPELMWNFRTGDRADGGLKDIRVEDGEVVVELYGQDRFLLGETETSEIAGDKEQLCCPTFYTRSRYKWNGRNFQLQGKRLTFSTADSSLPPVENMIEVLENQKTKK